MYFSGVGGHGRRQRRSLKGLALWEESRRQRQWKKDRKEGRRRGWHVHSWSFHFKVQDIWACDGSPAKGCANTLLVLHFKYCALIFLLVTVLSPPPSIFQARIYNQTLKTETSRLEFDNGPVKYMCWSMSIPQCHERPNDDIDCCADCVQSKGCDVFTPGPCQRGWLVNLRISVQILNPRAKWDYCLKKVLVLLFVAINDIKTLAWVQSCDDAAQSSTTFWRLFRLLFNFLRQRIIHFFSVLGELHICFYWLL